MAKKHLVVEWFSWLPYRCDFINFTILEIKKDIPNTLPSLKLLEERLHELVGRSTDPPPPQDNVVGSKRLRSGRVKEIKNFEVNNGISVNILGLEGKDIYTLRRGANLPKEVNLLLISEKGV